jgi:hypothetical protein
MTFQSVQLPNPTQKASKMLMPAPLPWRGTGNNRTLQTI